METDKISGSLEVAVAGVLRRQLAAEGDELPVGALVAVVADADASEDEIEAMVAAFQASFVPRAATGEAEGRAPEKIDVAGRRIRYLRRGEGGEPPALLIHGFGGDLGNWRLLRDALTSARFPTLVIWGGKDRIIPASHAAGLPASVRVEVIPEAGHMVQMEAAGAVNRLLQAHWADPTS